ncbi:MAG: GntR family transcriptional regulator [Ferrovibrio sp.]|uniref:GntR family transcriptional regulator n=1 Tax=Ferrovibrio sp. TaxID=1917215 RepID=UPI003918C0D9
MAKNTAVRPARLERPKSLTELVKDHVRSRITNGELMLGEALSENVLAAQLGISKTPVREALLQLKLEGLVDIQPQRGSFVFSLAPDEAAEMCQYRVILESAALRDALANDEAGLIEALEQNVKRMAKAVADGDIPAYRRLDTEYHRHILNRANNRFLTVAHQQLEMKIQALRARVTSKERTVGDSLAEHQNIVKLLKAHERTKALNLLGVHIRAASRDYQIILREQARGRERKSG